MKTKHPTLHIHIRKFNTHFYKNTKTGALIHRSKLKSHCPVELVNSELKHEKIMQSRWDLNRD